VAAPSLTNRRTLRGWGRTAPSTALVVEPSSCDELAEIVAQAPPRGVIARGLGRSYGDVAQNAGGLVVDTHRLTRVVEFDEEHGVITAEAGCSLDALVDVVLPRGWFLPVTPGTASVTLGGAIAADVHGKNHHRDGAFARHVESLTLITPAGEQLELGPGTSGFDATAGGLGLTGIVARCTLRLLPVETGQMVVTTERARGIDELLAQLTSTDHLYRYSVAWVDGRARGAKLGRSVLLRGDHATRDDLPGGSLARERGRRLGVPPAVSAALLLRGPALSAYNVARFRRAREGRSTETVDTFFYPLDAIADWNRLYGRRGLVQYQFAVPFGAEETVRSLLERFAAANPVLVVLKQFGDASGPLSFPFPGWTVALDFAASTSGLAQLLDDADEVVAQAGGRIYLAKDARMHASLLERMYPRLEEWRSAQSALDQNGVMRCDLARRVRLVTR